jgi:hypothetical protein
MLVPRGSAKSLMQSLLSVSMVTVKLGTESVSGAEASKFGAFMDGVTKLRALLRKQVALKIVVERLLIQADGVIVSYIDHLFVFNSST